VSRLLQENDIEPTVIELNMDTIRKLKEQGIRAVYGDATHRDTLLGAGIETAGSLILSASDGHSTEEVIRLARELNPDIRVLARANYVRDLAALHQAGAGAVFAGESEVALAMAESMLRSLGATHEQIDRERDRVRAEVLGPLEKHPTRVDKLVASSPANEPVKHNEAAERVPTEH
jgi:CPA2 family monovalent cation:H+ antiporter-2